MSLYSVSGGSDVRRPTNRHALTRSIPTSWAATREPPNHPLGLANSESVSAQHWFGDYQGLTTAGGVFHAVWNDTSPGHLELFTAAIAAAPSG